MRGPATGRGGVYGGAGRGGDTFNDACTLVLDHGEGLYPADQRRILDLLGAERDAAWAEAKRLEAALGVEAGG